MNEELHPKSDVAQLYVSRINGGRWLIGCKDKANSKKKWPRLVCQKQYRKITNCSQTRRTITHEEIVDPKEFKKTKEEQRKNDVLKQIKNW